MGLQFCMNPLSLSFFSINLMIVCLLDVLKCPFALVSDIESIKISFHNVSKMFHKIVLLIYRYLEIYHVACFLENCINPCRLNRPHKFCFIFTDFWNIDMTEKTFNFCPCFLFALFKKSLIEFYYTF